MEDTEMNTGHHTPHRRLYAQNEHHYTEYPTKLLYLPNGTDRLLELGEPRHYAKGDVIARQGVIPDRCYVVKSGRILAYEFTVCGNERVYNIMEKGSLFLDANLLMQVAAPIYFRAAAPSELVCIDRSALLRGICSDPDINMDIIESISLKFLSAMDQIRESGAHDARWKICNLLLIFADQYGEPYDGKTLIKQSLSQQMMSNLLGINRITTVRIIKNLKGQNLIEQINGFYCIRDTGSLMDYMESADTSDWL
jgi:CRP/FNR family transcriptional regulator